MTTPTYDPKITAVLLVDPYNDFLSEGGKLWSRTKPIAEEVGLLEDAAGIVLAACGVLGPLLAAFIHVASEMTFILNSARLLPRSSHKSV
jgi:hypothetical protein